MLNPRCYMSPEPSNEVLLFPKETSGVSVVDFSVSRELRLTPPKQGSHVKSGKSLGSLFSSGKLVSITRAS